MQVINFRHVNSGMMRGSFSLKLKSGIIIYKCSLIHGKDGQFFVAMPNEKSVDKDTGTTKYYPHIGFENNELKRNFLGEALATVQRYLKDNPEVAYGGNRVAMTNRGNDEEAPF